MTHSLLLNSRDAQTRPPAERAPARGSARADIQGLRMVAVVAVIANHLWSWPRGGFVGVDVFFVISGFLISDHLVRQRAQTGRISFGAFYLRRARRILPAAVVTLLATLFATAMIVGAGREAQVRTDAIWSLFFVQNWHMASIGTNYFADSLTSPLQHFWSLSVEEQFYLVWPGVILLTYLLARGHRRTWWILAGAMGLVCAVSFGYSVWDSQASPTEAYFSTLDRGWELAAGALVAMTKPYWSRIGALAAGLLGWSGLVGIVLSVFLVQSTHFPAPWAALPVLSTALVLGAGVAHPQRHLVPLVNPVAGYLGDISYSLYLWHFPIIVLAVSYFPHRGVAYSLWCLGLALLASVACYHLVEQPFRSTAWWRDRDSRHTYATAWVLLALVPLVIVIVQQASYRTPTSTMAAAGLELRDSRGASLVDQVQKRLTQALNVTQFPALKPAVPDLGFENWFHDMLASGGCTDVEPKDLASCRFGDPAAPKQAVVLGDSYAMAWMPGIRQALPGYRIQQLTLQECPVWDVSVHRGSGESYDSCATWRTWALQQIARLHPDLVIATTSQDTLLRLTDNDDPQDEVRTGVTKAFSALKASAGRVVVLAPPPHTVPLEQCVTNVGSPSDCVMPIDQNWSRQEQIESTVAAQLGITYVDTRSWFCVDGRCPGFVGSTPVTVDGSHLSMQYSADLTPLLRQALAG